MIAPNLISDHITPLQITDTGEQALGKMHEYNLTQLPVVEGSKYVGLISMDDVINMKHLSKPISRFSDSLHLVSVLNSCHIFDVMKTALDFHVRAVPVVNEEGEYLGLISAESCLRSFATLNSVKEPGGIIELEKDLKDYSLSELARIIEENDAGIFCLYTNVSTDKLRMQITVKVNTNDLGAMIATFERFNYEIKAVYNEKEYTEDLKDRYDALMRYLNV